MNFLDRPQRDHLLLSLTKIYFMKRVLTLFLFYMCAASLLHAQRDSLYGLKIAETHVVFTARKPASQSILNDRTTAIVRYNTSNTMAFSGRQHYRWHLPQNKESTLHNILNISGSVLLELFREKQMHH